jgi:hypothetical protein
VTDHVSTLEALLSASSCILTLLYCHEHCEADCVELEAVGAHTSFAALCLTLPLVMGTDSETLGIVRQTQCAVSVGIYRRLLQVFLFVVLEVSGRRKRMITVSSNSDWLKLFQVCFSAMKFYIIYQRFEDAYVDKEYALDAQIP